jgi:hypothetical protein
MEDIKPWVIVMERFNRRKSFPMRYSVIIWAGSKVSACAMAVQMASGTGYSPSFEGHHEPDAVEFLTVPQFNRPAETDFFPRPQHQ